MSALHGPVCACASCARADLPECAGECGSHVAREGQVCERCAERALDLAAEIADAGALPGDASYCAENDALAGVA